MCITLYYYIYVIYIYIYTYIYNVIPGPWHIVLRWFVTSQDLPSHREAWPSLMKVLQDPPVDDPHEPGLQVGCEVGFWDDWGLMNNSRLDILYLDRVYLDIVYLDIVYLDIVYLDIWNSYSLLRLIWDNQKVVEYQ